MADELGFDIGELEEVSDHDLRMQCRGITFKEKFTHPSTLAAIAQHHGVATRWVDWTFDPLTAAFFAAEDLITSKLKDNSKSIAVWALEYIHLRPKSRLVIRRIPTFKSRFINAQRGVFIFDKYADDDFLETGTRPCMATAAMYECTHSRPIVRKIVLNWKHVRKLYALLLLEGVNRARLMPTLDNVAVVSRAQLDAHPASLLLRQPNDDKLVD
ncbi:MAG TPA: FRG domain-containing protein [Phycisphaerales bacterium]|nr:FRG domain-containing protein [Phycisphaerales bacterium]